MGRVANLVENTFSGSTLLKSGEGTIFSITIAYANAAAGQSVVLRDGLDGNAKFAFTFVLPAANGTFYREWSQGKYFTTGIYLHVQGSGQIQGEVTYR